MTYNYLKKIFTEYSMDYSKTDRTIANYFLEISSNISNKTLEQLSKEIGVSKTTIFNFVTKHGFDGFQSFKIEIAKNHNNSIEMSNELVVFSDISAEDDPYTIAKKIVHSSKVLLDNLLYSLSDETLNEALELIKNANTLHFFGQASSSIIAFDCYHKFLRTKFNCNYIFDYHIQLSYSTKLTEDDCVFLFSHSGQTKETINIAKLAQKNGAKIIVLTGNSFSELAKYANVLFVIQSEETAFKSEALVSKKLYLTIIDILFISILYLDEESSLKSVKDIREALAESKLHD